MSDGPYSSLPMRRGWKRFAEFGDNCAFAPGDVAAAIIPALADDCRQEIPAGFLDLFSGIFNSMFHHEAEAQLEELRHVAGNGLGQSAIEYAIQIAARDGASEATAVEALEFLTGDQWDITFYAATRPVSYPQQGLFALPSGINSVMPFSDGLDSRAVAGLMALQFGSALLRVRLGTKDYCSNRNRPFQAVPYKVMAGKGEFRESTARSRGFKFAVISALTAYLAKARQVIVAESGQGSIGPALVVVGQAHGDFRNHPLYTRKIESLVRALLGHDLRFHYPRVWHTKAETLREFVNRCDDGQRWSDTKSCWQQNRQSSVDGKWRHCGVCAACILRRLSVHAAGLQEPAAAYIWENLGANSFEQGAAASFGAKRITEKMRQYAIAGILRMDHLAGLRSSSANASMLGLTAFHLGRALEISEPEAREKLDRLLFQHEKEWKAFMGSLGQSAFVSKWVAGEQ